MILTDKVTSKDTKSYKRYKELQYVPNKEGYYDVAPVDLSEGSHQVVVVKCDSGKNSNCLGVFEREWRLVVKQRRRIGNKDYCMFCQKTEEFSGRSNPNTKYFFDDSLLDNVDTAEKAYLLGWIASDGAIRHSGSIAISVRDYDCDILLKLRAIVDTNLPIAEIKSNMLLLTINSTQMSRACVKHLKLDAAGKKDTKVQFPDLATEELQWAFLRGYYEGDGSLNSRRNVFHPIPRVNISSNSIGMLESIRALVGVGNVYTNTTNNQHSWEISSGAASIHFLDKLYQNNFIPRLNRKYDLYCTYSSWKPSVDKDTIIPHPLGEIHVVKSNKNAVVPSINDINASGIDLHIIEKVQDFTSTVSLYTTGIKVKPPTGYYFILVGRSSISKSGYSLANAIGIIDQNYIGEIMVALRKDEDMELTLPNRLVQLVLMPKLDFDLVLVDELEDSARGTGGFGSTGVN